MFSFDVYRSKPKATTFSLLKPSIKISHIGFKLLFSLRCESMYLGYHGFNTNVNIYFHKSLGLTPKAKTARILRC